MCERHPIPAHLAVRINASTRSRGRCRSQPQAPRAVSSCCARRSGRRWARPSPGERGTLAQHSHPAASASPRHSSLASQLRKPSRLVRQPSRRTVRPRTRGTCNVGYNVGQVGACGAAKVEGTLGGPLMPCRDEHINLLIDTTPVSGVNRRRSGGTKTSVCLVAALWSHLAPKTAQIRREFVPIIRLMTH